MSLTLHYHPLASYCWKPLIALSIKVTDGPNGARGGGAPAAE